MQGGFFLLAEIAPPASLFLRVATRFPSFDRGTDVNGVRLSTNGPVSRLRDCHRNMQHPMYLDSVSLVRVSLMPTNVDDDNVMGVIERKPPSSFSRRSPSGDGGFERFHPPCDPSPLRPIPCLPRQPFSSTQPQSFSLIPFARLFLRPNFLRPPSFAFLSSTSYDFRFSRTSSRINHSSLFLSMSLPSPLFSSSSHRLPPAHTALHTRSLSDSSTPSLPLIPESHPRGELSVSHRFLLRNFPVVPSSFSSFFFSSLPPRRSAHFPALRVLPVPTDGALARKKREERSRPKYDPRLSCARGAVWICARSEIRATKIGRAHV